jgi:hypothetical protein
MEAALGLSMTSSRVAWVLLDCRDPEGPSLDHDAFDITPDDGLAKHVAAVRGARSIATASGHEVTRIGVTWTHDVQEPAALLRKALSDHGFDTVRAVAMPTPAVASEEAQLALARGAALAPSADAKPTEQSIVGQHSNTARRRARFGSHARAGAVLVAGVIALFVIVPVLTGRDTSRAQETQQIASSSHAVAVPSSPTTSASINAVRAAAPEPSSVRPVVVAPAPAPRPTMAAAPPTPQSVSTPLTPNPAPAAAPPEATPHLPPAVQPAVGPEAPPEAHPEVAPAPAPLLPGLPFELPTWLAPPPAPSAPVAQPEGAAPAAPQQVPPPSGFVLPNPLFSALP